MSISLTILGCGSSGGVPRIGQRWGACDPENPKNFRRRAGALVRQYNNGGATTILIDTPPDLRESLLSVNVGTVDGVLYTHDHADHTHGIDDLRVLAFNTKARVPVYFDKSTGSAITEKFSYCFHSPPGSAYPAIAEGNNFEPYHQSSITGAGGEIAYLPFLQAHGDGHSIGFRFGNIAYSTDVSGLSDDAAAALQGLDIWVLDALRYTPHPSHFSVSEALEWIERIKPKRAILSHLHIDLDYETLKAELPDHVEPAFDGLTITSN